MYIIYIFRTIVLIFVALFITTFRPLYAPAFSSRTHDTVDKGVG